MDLELIVQEENTEDLRSDFPFDPDRLAEEVCRAVLQREHFPADAQVSLTYVTDESIRQLNCDYRGIDRATDVLSFPNLPFGDADGPDGWSLLQDPMTRLESEDPDSGRILLGDIVLNLQRVPVQAGEYGHSVKREFAFLIAHSMLHLCGYDHMTPEDADRMFALQEEILAGMHIVRESAQ